ncbi:MAG: DNA recombination protein RecN, partial [Aquificota bacterium]
IRVLQEQVREIEDVGLLPEEYEALRERLRELSKAERINSLVFEGLALVGLEGGIKEKLNKLSKVLAELSTLTNKHLDLEEFYEKLSELERALRSYRVEYNTQELDRLNERLYKVQSLERKYRMGYGELYEHMLKLKGELESLLGQEEDIQEVEERLKRVREELEEVYRKLSEARLSKKEEFEQKVKENLKDMGLEHAEFLVHFEEKEGRYGKEQIRFLFSSHGANPEPIERVASGGEISRLSLALFMLSPPKEAYLLDEVDTGVSGYTSVKLARLLKRLSKSTQLIVITHLPAVASVADKHFTTKKVIKEGKPYITVEELRENRLEEIARLMGVVNEKTLMGAKALMEELRHV